jgi:hypothetical protein
VAGTLILHQLLAVVHQLLAVVCGSHELLVFYGTSAALYSFTISCSHHSTFLSRKQDNWDDDDIEDEFTQQLRAELMQNSAK